MPLAPSDIHICLIDDGAPRTRRPPQQPTAVRTARPGIWLVLSLCPFCRPLTGRYCAEHNATNWWLTTWGR